MHKILVNVMREEIRMAVIDEDGQLVDFVLERTDSLIWQIICTKVLLRTY